MDSELESEEKTIQKPDLRRRLKLSFWLLLLLTAITGWRVYLVRWPTEGPSWNGLTVGKSTTEDVVVTLGAPLRITKVRLSRKFGESDWLEDTFSQKVEVGTTIHLALDELQTSDLPLDLTIAPWKSKSGQHSGFVLTKTTHKSLEFRHVTAFCFL